MSGLNFQVIKTTQKFELVQLSESPRAPATDPAIDISATFWGVPPTASKPKVDLVHIWPTFLAGLP